MKVHVDTNGLLACILDDRPGERARTAEWVRDHGALTVDECVLAEACWVLESVYMHPRRKVAQLLLAALASEELMAWDPELTDCALSMMHRDPKLGIVDCILAARTLTGDLVRTFNRRLSRAIENL
ncbi:MAG: PIN domain-containing protein [Coriobacteriia bacterium]|nr:PIN domain-containing protein [Coriobacteriia bacterium]